MPPVWRSQIEAYGIHHGKGLDIHLSLALAFSTIPVTARFYPKLEGGHPGGESGASNLSCPVTHLKRELEARRLFRVPPCRAGTTHLQTSMSSPGFEPKPYGTVVSVTNHYIEWATCIFLFTQGKPVHPEILRTTKPPTGRTCTNDFLISLEMTEVTCGYSHWIRSQCVMSSSPSAAEDSSYVGADAHEICRGSKFSH
ncbi:hypothetical protein TNCV_2813481 [Trichonephila clavipes]|nr:hypothetical protein TNCV_2813481 [Trichonephila clavipes]